MNAVAAPARGTEVEGMNAKAWYRSKTLWVNAIAMLALGVQSHTGFLIDAEAQVALLGVVNLVLRIFTGQPIAAGDAKGGAGRRVLVVLWILAMLVSTIIFAACTTSGYLRTVSASGDILVAVGKSYVATGDTFKALCARQVIAAEYCAKWRTAAIAFKPAYAAAVAAWKKAANEQDARGAAVQILGLSDELTQFALIAAQAAKGGR